MDVIKFVVQVSMHWEANECIVIHCPFCPLDVETLQNDLNCISKNNYRQCNCPVSNNQYVEQD